MSVRPAQVESPRDLPPVRMQQLDEGDTVFVLIVEWQLFVVLACCQLTSVVDFVSGLPRLLPAHFLTDADGTHSADETGLVDQLFRSQLDLVSVFIQSTRMKRLPSGYRQL